MNKVLSWLLLCFVLIIFFACSTSEKFRRLKKLEDNFSNFYLLRPFSPALALWSFEIKILKYKDKFDSKETPTLIKKFDLRVGNFIRLKLSKGYYRLSSPFFKDSDKIIFLDGESETFYNFYLFSNDFFSKPELFFQEIKKEEALEYLLEGNHMSEHDLSER